VSQTRAQLLDTSVLPLPIAAGSASAPSIYYVADPSTGIYFPSSGQFSITTAGTQRLYINADGQVALSLGGTSGAPEPWPIAVATGTKPTLTLQNWEYQCLVLTDKPASSGVVQRYGTIASARYSPSHKAFTVLGMGDSGSGRQIYIGGGGWDTPDATDINFYTAPTYTETDNTGLLRMYIDPAGNVVIDANSTSFAGYPIRLHVAANGSDYYQMVISGYGNNANGGYLSLYQTRGATSNADGAVLSGDTLGAILFSGNVGSGGLDDAGFGASIYGYAEANWTSSTNRPGYLSFDTSPGTTDPVERMRITAAGIVLVGTSSASGSSLLQVNSDALINGITVGRGTGGVSTNTAVGNNALLSNTTGAFNTCIGYQAGQSLTTGNNNTIIGSIAGTAGLSNTVIIGAGTAERLRIDSSGNVGIGTTTTVTDADWSAGSKYLKVTNTNNYAVLQLRDTAFSGSLFLSSASTIDPDAYLWVQSSDFQINLVNNNNLKFLTNNSERMRINTAGALAFGGSGNTGTTGQVLTSQGSSAVPLWGSAVTAGTSVVTTSGAAVDFTGIPSWVKQIVVLFDLVSTTGTSPIEIRLGSSGGFGPTTYNSSCQRSGSGAFSTTGLIIDSNNGATLSRAGAVIISNINSNTWVSNGSMAMNAGTGIDTNANGGRANLSAVLTQVRIITQGGTDTFDAGRVNIMYQ